MATRKKRKQEKAPLEESVQVRVRGLDDKTGYLVRRADMSDEEWLAVQKRLGKDVDRPYTPGDVRPATAARAGDVLIFRTKKGAEIRVPRGTASTKEWEAIKKRAAQFEDLETIKDAATGESRFTPKPGGGRTLPDNPQRAVPEEDVPLASAGGPQREEEEDEEEAEMADEPGSPRPGGVAGFIGRSMLGATGEGAARAGREAAAQVTGADFTAGQPSVTNPPPSVDPVGAPNLDAGFAGPGPTGAQAAVKLAGQHAKFNADAVGTLAESVGAEKLGGAIRGIPEYLTPPPPVQGPDAQVGIPPGIAAPPMVEQPPGPDPVQLAMQAAQQMPGGFKPVQADPNAMLVAEQERARALAQGKANIEESKALQQQAAALDDEAREHVLRQMTENENIAVVQKQAILNGLEQAQRHQTAREATLEEVRRVSAMGTDPHRYWNNKSSGQKALAILGAALAGLGGKGGEYLRRIDSLVDRDINMQQADRATRLTGLKAVAEGQLDAREFALRAGATEAEAVKIERSAKYESMKMYLDQVARSTSNIQTQQAAIGLQDALSQRMTAIAQEGAQLASLVAHQQNAALADNARLRQEKARFGIQMGLSTAKGKDKKPPGASENLRIEAYDAAITQIGELEKLVDPDMGARVVKKMAATLGLPTDSTADARLFDMMKEGVAIMVSKSGAMADAEAKRLLGNLGSAHDLNDVRKILGPLKALLAKQRDSFRSALDSQNYNVGTTSTPAAAEWVPPAFAAPR